MRNKFSVSAWEPSLNLFAWVSCSCPGKNIRWDPANPTWDPRCVPGGIPPFSGGIPPGIMEHPTWDPANWSCFSKPWFKFLRRRREVVKMATKQRRGKQFFLKRAHLLGKKMKNLSIYVVRKFICWHNLQMWTKWLSINWIHSNCEYDSQQTNRFVNHCDTEKWCRNHIMHLTCIALSIRRKAKWPIRI